MRHQVQGDRAKKKMANFLTVVMVLLQRTQSEPGKRSDYYAIIYTMSNVSRTYDTYATLSANE